MHIAEAIQRWTPFDYRNAVPYPYGGLNRVLLGMRPGLIVVGARPGIGKSAMACDMALHAAAKHHVLFLSLEMTVEALTGRLLSYVSGLPMQTILDHPDDLRIKQAGMQLSKLHLLIDDSPLLTPPILQEKLRVQKDFGPQLVIIDYLQIVQKPPTERTEMVQTYIDLCRATREIAKEHRIPIVMLSQLKRPEHASSTPRTTDLFGGSGIEQAADVIMLLHRSTIESEEELDAKIIIAKNRDGPTDTVPMTWDYKLGKWAEIF